MTKKTKRSNYSAGRKVMNTELNLSVSRGMYVYMKAHISNMSAYVRECVKKDFNIDDNGNKVEQAKA